MQKSCASTRVAPFRGTSIAHENRNKRGRSIAQEGWVLEGRPHSWSSRGQAATGSIIVPSLSTSWSDWNGVRGRAVHAASRHDQSREVSCCVFWLGHGAGP